MDTNSYTLLVAIGKCHRLLKDHAAALASHPTVKAVTHWCDMPDVVGAFRLEEYVDAELHNGEAVSYCLELTITHEAAHLEADVRRLHSSGQDVMATIANHEFTNVADGSKALVEITQSLCVSGPALL